MVLSKSVNLGKAVLLLLVILIAMPCYAQYTDFRILEELKGNEPAPRAILWSTKKKIALVHYKDQHTVVCEKVHLDDEWWVKEIKRESIVFGKDSDKRYVELYIDPSKRPNKINHGWSFFGLPITIWESLELLAEGFGKNVVMHSFCTGAVTPQLHAQSMNEFLTRTMPEHHRSRMDGNTLYVYPSVPPNESWTSILNRTRKFNHKALAIRYPNLEKKGNVKYVGDDIQYVLRVISLGGETPITFPKDMHFSVYACYKDVPFSKILCDIVYTNQCIIAEREFGLEVIPWPGKPAIQKRKENYCSCQPTLFPLIQENVITADPDRYDEVSGSGPYPPPLIADPRFMPAVVADKCMALSQEGSSHPVVVQPGYQGKSFDKAPADINYKYQSLPLPPMKGKDK